MRPDGEPSLPTLYRADDENRTHVLSLEDLSTNHCATSAFIELHERLELSFLAYKASVITYILTELKLLPNTYFI